MEQRVYLLSSTKLSARLALKRMLFSKCKIFLCLVAGAKVVQRVTGVIFIVLEAVTIV